MGGWPSVSFHQKSLKAAFGRLFLWRRRCCAVLQGVSMKQGYGVLGGGVAFCALLQLSACSSPAPAPEQTGPSAAPWVMLSAGNQRALGWKHHPFPGKSASQFRYVQKDGRAAMAANSVSSASMLRQVMRVESDELADLRFSWKVPALIAHADMALRDADDSPVRILLMFEGDRSKFSSKNAMLSELARALTGEELPYATLMYVWCNTRAPGTVIVNPRTDRIRKLVVESGAGNLQQWIDYKRDIRKDYEAAFGEAPGALVGIGIMTDSDNTGTSTQAWYGPVTLGAAAKGR